MAFLVYADTDGVERSLTVGAEPVLVGRANECAIRSSDPRVSRTHARFYVDHTGTLHVEDLGSSNGVFVGQHRVSHSAVPMNELVLVGSLAFRLVAFDAAQEPHEAATVLHADPAPLPQSPPLQAVDWSAPGTQPAAMPWAQPAPPPAAPPWQPQPQPAEPAWSAPAPPSGAAPWPQPAPQPAAAAWPQHAQQPQAAWSPPAPPTGNAPWPQPAPPPADAPWQPAPPPAAAHSPQPAWSPPDPPAQPAPSSPQPASLPQADSSAAGLETERKARLAAEEERDAYGARMAELHQELRTMKQALDAARAELAKPRVVASDAEIQRQIDELVAERTRLATEAETVRERLADADEQVKSAEARLRSTEEELSVARTDLMASEERLVTEIAAHEQRSSAELTSRVEELEVTRADLIKAEERILDLSRTVSELEQKLAQSGR